MPLSLDPSTAAAYADALARQAAAALAELTLALDTDPALVAA